MPMLMSDILNRAIIIDDKEKDIVELRGILEAIEVSVEYYKPEQLNDKKFNRNRQLIFMDLMLDGDKNHTTSNISTIIKILSNNLGNQFGLYGLVVWTTHREEVEELKKRIGEAYKKTLNDKATSNQTTKPLPGEIVQEIEPIKPPLFIVHLDKNKYTSEGYGSLLSDLITELKQDTAASFFTSWYGSVLKGAEKSIHDIYSLAPEYPKQNEEIKYLLYRIGLNHIGISKKNASGYNKITEDALKAFDELLSADLNSQERDLTNIFQSEPQKPWADKLYTKLHISAKLNTKFFVDVDNLSDKHIVPGNVYKVIREDSPLIINDRPNDINNKGLEFENVAIELTPPCDFSNKKVGSRLIGGFAFELKDGITKRVLLEMKNALAVDRYYRLCMVILNDKIMVFCFDFRYLFTPSDTDLLDSSQYQLLFRAKPKLFADVLQKFSSHAARLGLSNIDLS